MIACAEGKPVEARGIAPITDWLDQSFPISFNFEQVEYRPKPEPVTRPWSKPQDVPAPVCWVRNSKYPQDAYLIVGIRDNGISYGRSDAGQFVNWTHPEFSNLEYSTDRHEWKPCVISE